MDELKVIFDMYSFEIVLAMGALIVLLFIFNIINRVKISMTLRKYKELNKVLSAGNSKNIEETLVNYVKEVSFMKNSLNSVEMRCEDINDKILKTIQKVGFIRYNAFDDISSDLSFSVALLDGKANGFVMSNIYARDESNVYAKPVENGNSTYPLSREEKEAIERAMGDYVKASR